MYIFGYVGSVACFVSAIILILSSGFEIYRRWPTTSEDIVFLVIPLLLC
jgi:hypothetical protein